MADREKKITRREALEKAGKIMEARMEKLEAKEGDVIIVREWETLQALAAVGPHYKGPKCPIICAPNGIQTISRAELERLLASLPPDPNRSRIIV